MYSRLRTILEKIKYFLVVFISFICGIILSAPAYGEFISQLIRYAIAYQNYFLYRARTLTNRLKFLQD